MSAFPLSRSIWRPFVLISLAQHAQPWGDPLFALTLFKTGGGQLQVGIDGDLEAILEEADAWRHRGIFVVNMVPEEAR